MPEKIIYQSFDTIDEPNDIQYSVDSFVEKHLGALNLNDPNSGSSVSSFNIISPPYDPMNLSCLVESVGRLSNCIKILVDNTVGLGWHLRVKKEYLDNLELRDEVKMEKEIANDFFNNPEAKIDFDISMEQVKKDQHSTGNGYLEVTKDLRGVPIGWKHIPAYTISITKSGLYLQQRNSKRIYFKPYGLDNAVDRDTGDVYEFGNIQGRLAEINLATEIIHFKTYSTRSSYYGIPDWIAVIENVYGNILAERRSLFILENESTPKYLIVTHGEQLNDDSKAELRMLFSRDLKGIENRGSVALLTITPKNAMGFSSGNKKIEVITIDGNNIAESGYQGFIDKNNEAIREIFGIASAFFTSEGANRSNSGSLKDITINNVFKPESRKTSRVINKTILRDLGLKYIEFVFNIPESQSEMDNSIINTRYAASGALSINDVRRRIGEDPMDFDFASLPPSVALALINKGLIDSPIKGK